MPGWGSIAQSALSYAGKGIMGAARGRYGATAAGAVWGAGYGAASGALRGDRSVVGGAIGFGMMGAMAGSGGSIARGAMRAYRNPIAGRAAMNRAVGFGGRMGLSAGRAAGLKASYVTSNQPLRALMGGVAMAGNRGRAGFRRFMGDARRAHSNLGSMMRANTPVNKITSTVGRGGVSNIDRAMGNTGPGAYGPMSRMVDMI